MISQIESEEDLKELVHISSLQAEYYFTQNKPLLSAAAHLSVGNKKSAVKALFRSGDYVLAYQLCKIVWKDALRDVSEFLADRAERYNLKYNYFLNF
jgi:hypothetical protein